MRKTLAFAAGTIAAISFSVTTLSAQSSAVLLRAPLSSNCPADIEARKTPQGGVMQVSPNGTPHPVGVNITVRAFGVRLISEAKITLSGIAGAHVLPAGSDAGFGDATELFTLTEDATPKATLWSVVYAEHLTGIRWVELNELTYADGTIWRQKPGAVCRVSPSRLLLVDASN